MINLFYFLSRYGGLLTFAVLELFSLWLIVRYNQTQRDIWLNSSRYYSGILYDKTARLSDLAGLARTADSLAQENAQLYARLYSQLALAGPETPIDTALGTFDFLPARIIKNSITLPDNNITLDKGLRDGIRPGMGVMLSNGVLGIVRSASPRFCRVVSVLNSQSHLSVAIQRNQAFGTLTWDGSDPGTLILEEVPKQIALMRGDTVVTSGFSVVFPPGIPIGVVSAHKVPPGSSTLRAEVRIFANLATVQRAYIIRNRFMDELGSLEGEEN
jgi:rod shape-determining protein MreC